MEALQTDASSIVSAYVTVQEEYKDASETSPTLADRAARFIGRRRAVINGIDQMNWGTLLLFAGSEGIHAHLQFLSQMIPPNKVGPISQYLQHRTDFAFALRQASADEQLAELYMLLFSEVEELSLVDSMPLLDTRVKAYYVLASLERLLDAMQNLNLSVDRLDVTREKAGFAYRRLDGYFKAEDDAELPSA